MKTYQRLMQLIRAYNSCKESGNMEWELKHSESIESILKNNLPTGSGIDAGHTIEKYYNNKIIIHSSFHSIDENGFYDKWIDYKIIIKPDLLHNLDLTITGKFKDKQYIKEYLYNEYEYFLNKEV